MKDEGMANQVHLEKLREGVEAWNQWRKENPGLQPDLQGANLMEAQLQGADLSRVQLQGAHLNEAFFDNTTSLRKVILSDDKYGVASLADVNWGGVNLAIVDWSPLKMLGDEYEARRRSAIRLLMNDKANRLEDYRTAVRANRQLAVVLRDQGLNEEADHFAYRAQLLQRVVLRRQGLFPKAKLWQRVQKLSAYVLSLFLDVLAGYGYHPAKTVFWYLFVICSFTLTYSLSGHLPLFPDAFVFSLMSFHGRGFFPSLSGETNLHNPLVVRAAFEAVVGLFIEISFIATFTQRFFGR